MNNAPILLFTYRRLHTLKQTIEALKANRLAMESDLFIFSDAAKEAKDQAIIKEVRQYLKEVSGFKSIKITEAKINKGLANSIISGVSEVIKTHGKVIVLEDDLITTPNFLCFMNACLSKYQQAENVFSISGYSFNLGHDPLSENDAYLLNRGWSWGWATWADRWENVDWDVKTYKEFITDRKAQKAFGQGGSDLNSMLQKQMTGKIDSWAIRWFYHQFHTKGLTVYPVFSKVYNAGFDEYATHTTGSNTRYLPAMDKENKQTFRLSAAVQLSTYYQKRFQKKMDPFSRLGSKIDTYIKKIFSK